MKITGLVKLMKEIIKYYENNDVIQKSDEFLDALKMYVKSSNQNYTQKLVQAMNVFLNAILKFDIYMLSFDEQTIAKRMKINILFGNDGKNSIENYVKNLNDDQDVMISNINEIVAQIKELYNEADNILNYLEFYVIEENNEYDSSTALIKMQFAGRAGIENIVDFDNWISIWYKIFRSFAIAEGRRPEEVRIVNVQKDSPLILEIAAYCGIVNLISTATLMILKNIDKYFEIKKKIKEIEAMEYLKIKEEITKKLNDEAERFRVELSKDIAKDLMKEIQIENKDGEIENGLAISIKGLAKYFEDGGKIEALDPQTERHENISEFEKIKIKYGNIKSMLIEGNTTELLGKIKET